MVRVPIGSAKVKWGGIIMSHLTLSLRLNELLEYTGVAYISSTFNHSSLPFYSTICAYINVLTVADCAHGGTANPCGAQS